MPDYIARRRLKQKVLERWENEGGRIEAADITSAHRNNPTRDSESDSNPSSPSLESSPAGTRDAPIAKRNYRRR